MAEADYLLSASAQLTFPAFQSDETLRRAFVRSLEVIGEAVKKLPASFRDDHPQIDWRAMAGMRDRLIHDYMGVDYELVWDVVVNHVPKLREQVAPLLETNGKIPSSDSGSLATDT